MKKGNAVLIACPAIGQPSASSGGADSGSEVLFAVGGQVEEVSERRKFESSILDYFERDFKGSAVLSLHRFQ